MPQVSAQTTTTLPPEPIPCKNVRKGCEATGFVVGQVNIGNGVWDNCFSPLSEGKIIPKVKVTDSLKKDIKECADEIKKRQNQK